MYNIEELIPQRAPMIMVDTFSGVSGNVSHTDFKVDAGNLFVDDGFLTECGIIENIAQSAAAYTGFLSRENNVPVSLGYIGSVNDFKTVRLPRTGETIHTSVRVLQEVFNITLIEARCAAGDEEIASCRMKIFLEK